ncbi:cytochrome P450 [Streptomyces daqingensis]|jgi:cytochrome P450|uniref:Cytochrome P450 n=1 Tax=Streptomyces daqingensis TaxID=1472640 RepID=A0ABQ2M274_9ACTN|nr:cytochrome P450 [Streptomyces daqingensis]GGO45855.1 cytochrome P450 [Streptomyces daqingensis]
MTADQAHTSGVPHIVLDPYGRDHHGEAAQLRERGPVVRVGLPGDVTAWSVARHDLLTQLAMDPRISKDWHNWGAMQRGEIPDDWPLIGMVKVTNMVTADGAEHRRLRKLVSQTFTARRVEELRPRTTAIVDRLLDELPSCAEPDGTVDLRRHFAYPVPMQVISDLFGIPEYERPELREAVDKIFRSDLDPEEVAANQIAVYRLLARVVELRGGERGDDLTSALITAREAEPDALTQEELVGTLLVMLSAGHETTLSLIVNAVRALLTHPGQLDLVQSRDDLWPAVVEETLRWDAPIGNFPFRYPTEDIEIGGVVIPAGDPIMAPYSAVGRDTAQHGPDAGDFDVTREQERHLAFGHGAHTCLGAPLARLEAGIALPKLFARYPGLSLAAGPETLAPVPSMFSNSVTTLPVRLGTEA